MRHEFPADVYQRTFVMSKPWARTTSIVRSRMSVLMLIASRALSSKRTNMILMENPTTTVEKLVSTVILGIFGSPNNMVGPFNVYVESYITTICFSVLMARFLSPAYPFVHSSFTLIYDCLESSLFGNTSMVFAHTIDIPYTVQVCVNITTKC